MALDPKRARKSENILTVGVYNEHAFFIKDIEKLAKIYECAHCNSRFTLSKDLKRHNEFCTKGQTLIWCGNKKVEKPRSSYLQAFFPDSQQHSKLALRWLSKIEKERKIHIHHSLCGHGGERQLLGGPVDGYHPQSETIFQFHGCYWHGCPKCYPNNRNRVLSSSGKTMQDKHEKTLARTAELRKNGFTVEEAWECQTGQLLGFPEPKEQTQSYPFAIFFDFESYGDVNERKNPTEMLPFESKHVPISVSIGDTLNREATHLCNKDNKKLIYDFRNELLVRHLVLTAEARKDSLEIALNTSTKNKPN